MRALIGVELLRKLPQGPCDVRDTKVKGFVLRARPSGTHTVRLLGALAVLSSVAGCGADFPDGAEPLRMYSCGRVTEIDGRPVYLTTLCRDLEPTAAPSSRPIIVVTAAPPRPSPLPYEGSRERGIRGEVAEGPYGVPLYFNGERWTRQPMPPTDMALELPPRFR